MSSIGPLRKANATSAFASLATPDRFLGVMVDFFIRQHCRAEQEYLDSLAAPEEIMADRMRCFPLGASPGHKPRPTHAPLLRTAGSYAVAAFACAPFISHSA